MIRPRAEGYDAVLRDSLGLRAADELLRRLPCQPAAALQAFDRGDVATFEQILAPTVPLSRHIFRRPTYAYKTGIVFLAWLNGHQTHFRMIGGAESWRSVQHLAELFRLADAAGLLADPELAVARTKQMLAVAGIE